MEAIDPDYKVFNDSLPRLAETLEQIKTIVQNLPGLTSLNVDFDPRERWPDWGWFALGMSAIFADGSATDWWIDVQRVWWSVEGEYTAKWTVDTAVLRHEANEDGSHPLVEISERTTSNTVELARLLFLAGQELLEEARQTYA